MPLFYAYLLDMWDGSHRPRFTSFDGDWFMQATAHSKLAPRGDVVAWTEMDLTLHKRIGIMVHRIRTARDGKVPVKSQGVPRKRGRPLELHWHKFITGLRYGFRRAGLGSPDADDLAALAAACEFEDSRRPRVKLRALWADRLKIAGWPLTPAPEKLRSSRT